MSLEAPRTIGCHAREGGWISPDFKEGLVSVIIPTYNRQDLVVETLDSVHAQTYRPIELIVVDDGSTDQTVRVTREWMDRHAEQETFVCRLIEQENSGAPAARNRGAAESTGEFIQFFDSDDLMLPRKLEVTVRALDEEHADVAISNQATFLGSSSRLIRRINHAQEQHTLEQHIHSQIITTLSAVYRRSAVESAGPWDEELTKWQDTEFCFRFLVLWRTDKLKLTWLPEPQGLHRDSPISITRQKINATWTSLVRACLKMESYAKSHGIDDESVKHMIGRRLSSISRQLRTEGLCRESDKVFALALTRLDPRRKLMHWSFHEYCKLCSFAREARTRKAGA